MEGTRGFFRVGSRRVPPSKLTGRTEERVDGTLTIKKREDVWDDRVTYDTSPVYLDNQDITYDTVWWV